MNPSNGDRAASAPDLAQVLAGAERKGGPGRLLWRLALAVALVAGAAALYLRFAGDAAVQQARYRTETAELGDLVVKVSATGKLQPTNQVDVGSELSGIVASVYVDDNDRVHKGQVLAQLDLAKLEDAVTRSRANLAAAEAQLMEARATVTEARAKLARYREVAKLSDGKVPSQSEMETAEAALRRAEAGGASARAAIAQARAALRSDETNVDKAHIRSPIDGLVLSREVEPGQTVAASFQAPVLFTIAEDLAKMELQVDVDEADVGQVEAGQQATFTVDAWPGRRFRAVITRVGYGAQEKEGVVSYQAVLRVANDDLKLRPGMTGTAEITTLTRQAVLLVPNAALRFTPPVAKAKGRPQGSSLLRALMPRPPRRAKQQPRNGTPKGGDQRVWVLANGEAVPRMVEVGASDGRRTEILAGGLQPGIPVITEALSTRP